MRRRFAVAVFLALVAVLGSAYAERDWEYWSQEAYSVPLNNTVNYIVTTEWRFNQDMERDYLFKVETGPSFRINEYLELAPYYVYQEKQSRSGWDRSDLMYFDTTVNFRLKGLFNAKMSNRFRYQYDFDKVKTVLRNTLKLSKGFNIGKCQLTPYLSEEPFYDCKVNTITEHRTTAGISCSFTKNLSFGLGYMLNSKKGASKWSYSNVLVSNLNIKF
ncbi:MAG: DUF2490 domain-containing protein [Candidatus Omnitrophica bacterium]|nr:DUF2490 domain-containing protein [Candidatus Omnitrophota bacterium]